MAVTIKDYEEFGKTNKVVIIDKSDGSHPKRILSIFREIDILNRTSFSVKAAWTPEAYHPTMMLDKEDIRELIQKLQELLV